MSIEGQGADPNTGTSLDDERVRYWAARKSRSEELKNNHYSDWSAYWRWYRNHIEPFEDPADWWRSNEPIPAPFKIVETLLPRYLLGMFDNPEWFNVEGRSEAGEDYENVAYNLIRTKVEAMKPFSKVYDCIKYTTITGHSWGKVNWREEYQNRQVFMPQLDGSVEQTIIREEVFNGPDFEWRSNDVIWPDPSGRGDWYIEEIETTVEKLEEIQDQLGIYDEEVLAQLRQNAEIGSAHKPSGDMSDQRKGTSTGVMVDRQREQAQYEGIPDHLTTPMADGIGVRLWQCWGWVSKEYRHEDDETDGQAWRLLVIADGRYVLRDVPSPTPDLRPPYFPIRSIRIPGRLYGESCLHYVGPLADQQSRLSNMRLDEVYLGVWPQFLARQGLIMSDTQLAISPGGIMQLNLEPQQKWSDVFGVLERPPVKPQNFLEDEYRQIQAEHAVGAQAELQGVQPSGGVERTATAAAQKLQQGSARHVLQNMVFSYDFQKELLERTWKWLQMRMPDEQQVRVGNGKQVINLADIQIPIDIVVGGGLFALSKQTRVMMNAELIELLKGVPQFAQVAKPIPIFQKLLRDRGWKNVDKYMMNEQEWQEMQERMRADALMAEALGGGNGTNASGSAPSTAMPNMPEGFGGSGMAPDNIGGGGI